MTLKWYGDDFLKRVKAATPEALFQLGERFVEDASSRAPRSSGVLADSGYVKSAKRSTYKNHKKHRKEIKLDNDEQVAAAFAAFYTRFIELGTRKRPAQPFIRPAVDNMKAQAGNVVQAHFKAHLR